MVGQPIGRWCETFIGSDHMIEVLPPKAMHSKHTQAESIALTHCQWCALSIEMRCEPEKICARRMVAARYHISDPRAIESGPDQPV